MLIEEIIKYIKNINSRPTEPFVKWLESCNDNIYSVFLYAFTNLITFDTVQQHLKYISSITILNDTTEREVQNRVAELIAGKFIEKILNYKITKMESNNTPNLSPFRVDSKKSCDICAESADRIHYFEVKDSSTENCSRKDQGDYIEYKPATRPYIEQWITWKYEEAIKKGATDLFVIVPIWVNPANAGDKFDTWMNAVFCTKYHILERKGNMHYVIKTNLSVPHYFNKLYIMKDDEEAIEIELVN